MAVRAPTPIMMSDGVMAMVLRPNPAHSAPYGMVTSGRLKSASFEPECAAFPAKFLST